MNQFVSSKKSDLKEELEHCELLYVAACPLETRSVLAETIVVMLEKMIAKNFPGHPCAICTTTDITDHSNCDGDRIWKEILEKIISGFKLIDEMDEYEMTKEQKELVVDAKLLFAEHFEHLWL